MFTHQQHLSKINSSSNERLMMPHHAAALPAPLPAQGAAWPHPGWARTTLHPDPSSPHTPGCVTGMSPETPTPRRTWWLVPLRGRSGPCRSQGRAQDLPWDAETLQQSPWQLQYTARANKAGGRGEERKRKGGKGKKKKGRRQAYNPGGKAGAGGNNGVGKH